MFEEKVLVKENKLGKLYMYWAEYSGKQFLHIRYWYVDKKDGIEKPGKKGIGIPSTDLSNVLQVLSLLLKHKPTDPVPFERKDQKKAREAREAQEKEQESGV